MSTINVLNKKLEVEGTAVVLEDGRYEVTIAGETKEVAASTFKRWYKVLGEAVTPQAVVELAKEREVSVGPAKEREVSVEPEAVATPQVKLTAYEIQLLNGMRINEYNDALDGPTWTFTAIDYAGIEPKKARGVISSLIKKGLVAVSDGYWETEEQTIGFTEAGAKLFDTATGKECNWGGPKLLAEIEVDETAELDAMLGDAEAVETATPEAAQVEEVVATIVANLAGVSITEEATRGGKCRKLITSIEYGQALITITEYDGYVCDVLVAQGEQVYKSTKMSIKDALENGLGLEGDAMKTAKKVIMQARKAAKQSMA